MIPPSGTHTASTAIGRAVGVAKDAELVAVRILDCGGSGTISDTIAGLDWIASRQPTTTTAVADGGATVSPSPGVVIMSLGVPSGTWAQSLAAAVQRLVTEHGVSVVVASGAPCITHIYRAWRQACYLKKLHPYISWPTLCFFRQCQDRQLQCGPGKCSRDHHRGGLQPGARLCNG